MKTINRTKPVLVTGGTGYLASWIIKLLLEEGLTVHTTVASIRNEKQYNYLQELQNQSPGKLVFFEADFLDEGSYEEALQSCELVFHTGYPFQISSIKDSNKQLITPAIQGVRNLFFSADVAGDVRRIVFTSSISAMAGDSSKANTISDRKINESHWNNTSTPNHHPYSYAKTIAEKEAWSLSEKFHNFDLVVINPGLMLGPSLNKRIKSTSIDLMIRLFSSKLEEDMSCKNQAFVDVRDVAKAHLRAGFDTATTGRHLTAAHLTSFHEVAQVVRKYYPNYTTPQKLVTDRLFKLLTPFLNHSSRFVDENIGFDFSFDNSYTRKDLQIDFLPLEKTILDHIDQLAEDLLISINNESDNSRSHRISWERIDENAHSRQYVFERYHSQQTGNRLPS
ncbi:NAD-dependent epimerase/dehydratase family protein [Mangrovibacterium sp.]|uniref:NAD-dependent epimerase/dehydratase family protein n=1 Tax=Mangrovibacterium sp. TaxID=1961364 RepID=UPI0035674708